MADERKVTADPAGLVEIEELNELTETQEVNGASTPTIVATVTATIGASAAICPTTKCSSKC
ncbi:class II lanthipeptide, LchA2/BrtA2 family [Inconstantimicrobium mannanitabidum]|uniref:Uncharacterized protein n=1 Tax=Inconstantimicrobium mannanitabidum TaxID=1604901 RepID=A0ACB5RIM4_9CLOT|nr:class II lanthipeptide, LchA2/BrtA2 family [Clostridium sp. TW13]GKX68942.1 hypothetical protein rsdtw13_42000 [Clostridium sp. TW13]